MLGHNAGRINQLEAENMRLRADLLAQTRNVDGLRTIIANLRKERDQLVMQVNAVASATQAATTAAQAGRGYVCGESVLERVSRN